MQSDATKRQRHIPSGTTGIYYSLPVLSPVEKSRTRSMLREISEPPATRWTPATPTACRFGGRFFR